MDKLLGRNLSQTLEASDFRVRSQVTDSLQPLLLAVTIAGDEVRLSLLLVQPGVGLLYHLLVLNLGSLVAHPEKRSLQDIDMTFLDQLWEELQEKVMISKRMCMPSTSASVATMTLL